MTYRELLELYKEGKLDENSRREVESEIEKQDAISEYLFEESKIPLLDELDEAETASETEAHEKFISYVQKSIRRAFVKAGIITGAAVLAVVLLVIFVLPDFVSLFYYSPAKIIEEEYSINQMSLDMAVYSDVFMPGCYRDCVSAEKLGYGKYRITILQISSPDGVFKNVNGIIERNKLVLYDSNVLKHPAGNAFLPTGKMENVYLDGETNAPMGINGTKEAAYNEIDKLNENQYYRVFVTLEEMMAYEDFYKWFTSLDVSDINLWCAVGVCDENGMIIPENMGFNVTPSGICFEWDKEKYPYLSLLDYNGDAYALENAGDGEIMKTHFISTLSYLRDNDDIVKLMTTANFNFDGIIESVKKDGLNIYGFYITAEKEDILKLREQQEVAYIGTEAL